MLKTRVTCGKCEFKSETYTPFMTRSLALESTLEKCIANFVREDVIASASKSGGGSGGHLYKCEKCKKGSKAKINTDFSRLPRVLVFHLKRFQFPSMKKISTKVKFNPYLDFEK
jgi:ubiquitin C-terminal hydrolase